MDIIQTFYNNMAAQYDKLFADWQAATQEQAAILDQLLRENGLDKTAGILDCACGIGTQAIGLAALGYAVTGSDISAAELQEAQKRAAENGVQICFRQADFRNLSAIFPETFDAVICMDNALPHMLSESDLKAAVQSIAVRVRPGGVFAASIRDYDALLLEKPAYSPPYIHNTDKGRRIAFQTWDWHGEQYDFTQYILEDEGTVQTVKFNCTYRAVRRDDLTALLLESGFADVEWKFPGETGFYQPIVLAKK